MTWTLRQLQAPSRVLELGDRAVPLLGWRTPSVGRGKAWQAPSSPDAVAILGGQTWEPTEFPFDWRAADFKGRACASTGSGERIGSPDELLALLQTMQAEEALVAVEWDAYIAVGWLARIDPQRRRPGDWLCEVTVAWTRVNAGILNLEPDREPTLRERVRDLADRWRQRTAGLAAPATAAREWLQGVREAGNLVSRMVEDAEGVVAAYEGIAQEAGTTARSAAATASGIASSSLTLAETCAAPVGQAVQHQDPAALLKQSRFVAQVRAAALDAQRQAQAIARSVRREARGYDVHVALQGEDLRLVAWARYTDAGAWRALARYNGLHSSRLTAGQRITLPPREVLG